MGVYSTINNCLLLFSFQIEFWLSEHLANCISWCITNLSNSSCEHQVVIVGRNKPSLYLLYVTLISTEAAFFEATPEYSNSIVWRSVRPALHVSAQQYPAFFNHPWNKCIVLLRVKQCCSCVSVSHQPSTQKQSTWGFARWRKNGSWECQWLGPDGTGSNGHPTGLKVESINLQLSHGRMTGAKETDLSPLNFSFD